MDTKFDPNDGGFASRKFVICLVSVGVMFVAAIIAAAVPAIATVYSSFVGGVVGVAAAYLTGNVAAKLAIGKVNNDSAATAKDSKVDDPDA